uniref:Integrase core domain containing protein n=1 Tax=Solanum tuberosum TaxID=4113 RepID=M1DY00_SOLTU
MPSTQSQGEPLTPYDPELNRILWRMNNQGVPVNSIGGELGDGVGLHPPRVGDENNQIQAENLLREAVRVQDQPEPRLHDNYRVNFNVAESNGPLVLPPLPPRHTFVVTSSLMQMLIARGLFVGLASKDPHAHDRFTVFIRGVPNHRIDDESLKEYFYRGLDDNSRAVLDTIAGGSYGECTFEQIAEKLEKISRNNKAWSTRKSETGRNTFSVYTTNNQSADEIREEMAQIRTEVGLVLKHVSGGAQKVNVVNYLTRNPPSIEECYYEEDAYTVNDQTGVSDQTPKIAEKLEKISRNNKAWSTRKSETGRNTFSVYTTNNQSADEIREEMAQIRTEVGLVLKHVSGGAQKVNVVNYLTRNPPSIEECYYEEDAYTVNDQTGVSDQTPKVPIRIIGAKVKETKVGTVATITERVNMSGMGTSIATTSTIGTTMATEMIGLDLMFPLKIGNLVLGKLEIICHVSGESENVTEKEAEVTQKVIPIPRPPPPFPQRSIKKSRELQSVSAITYKVRSGSEEQIEERLGVEAIAAIMKNFESDGIEEYDELVAALDRCEYRLKPKKLELDMKTRESPPARPSVEETPKLELKALPSHLRSGLRSVDQSTDRSAHPWFPSETNSLGPLIYGRDPRTVAYVLPATRTSLTTPRATQNTSRQVVTDVVTVSQSDEENTLIGSPPCSASSSEADFTSGSDPAHASGSEAAHDSGFGSGSVRGSGSHDKATLSDEATSSGEVPVP